MGWFESQLEQRKRTDKINFANAMDSIAGAVMGERLSRALDANEIAHSAIEEILKYYHHTMSDEELPSYIHTVTEQIAYYMEPYGIVSRSVTLDKGWYHHAVGVMLGTLKEDGSAVALIPGTFSGYSFLNLKTGKRVRLNHKTEKLIDEDALYFSEAFPLRALTVKDLFVFMFKQYNTSDIVMYFGMMLVMTMFGWLSPLFTQWLFGNVLQSGNMNVLFAMAGFMLSYSLCQIMLGVYQTLVNSRIGTKQQIAVESAVMNRILSLPTSFFKQYSAGELSQHASYVQSLCTSMMDALMNTGIRSVFSLAYIGQIFQFAPALVLPSVLITLASLLYSMITMFGQMKLTKKKMLASSKLSGLTYSTISGIQKIKLAGAEKRMFVRWSNAYVKEAECMYNPPAYLKFSGIVNTVISMTGTLILYFLAVQSHVSVADYYAFNASYGLVSGALTSLFSMVTTFAGIKPTLDMAKPILEAEPEYSEGKRHIHIDKGAIELSHVTFRYSDDMPNVIRDLSMRIKAGEYVAIVGSTGCGKSTLLRLLLGFEKPQSGAIYFDRNDISNVDLKSLRHGIGVVMQDGKLFNGDVYSNIMIAAPEGKLSDAWEAAKLACIDEDIRALPMGMFTLISEGQGGISGGQRQRIMIARALASKPKILMFDEATSALDNVTQKKISEAIDTLKCTRIVIAHRLSTIRHADRILYLENGGIAEEGTYEELIAKQGRFAELVERQRLDI